MTVCIKLFPLIVIIQCPYYFHVHMKMSEYKLTWLDLVCFHNAFFIGSYTISFRVVDCYNLIIKLILSTRYNFAIFEIRTCNMKLCYLSILVWYIIIMFHVYNTLKTDCCIYTHISVIHYIHVCSPDSRHPCISLVTWDFGLLVFNKLSYLSMYSTKRYPGFSVTAYSYTYVGTFLAIAL